MSNSRPMKEVVGRSTHGVRSCCGSEALVFFLGMLFSLRRGQREESFESFESGRVGSGFCLR